MPKPRDLHLTAEQQQVCRPGLAGRSVAARSPVLCACVSAGPPLPPTHAFENTHTHARAKQTTLTPISPQARFNNVLQPPAQRKTLTWAMMHGAQEPHFLCSAKVRGRTTQGLADPERLIKKKEN